MKKLFFLFSLLLFTVLSSNTFCMEKFDLATQANPFYLRANMCCTQLNESHRYVEAMIQRYSKRLPSEYLLGMQLVQNYIEISHALLGRMQSHIKHSPEELFPYQKYTPQAMIKMQAAKEDTHLALALQKLRERERLLRKSNTQNNKQLTKIEKKQLLKLATNLEIEAKQIRAQINIDTEIS